MSSSKALKDFRTSYRSSKDHFTVYDAVGVLDYFKDASDFTENPPSKPTRSFDEIVTDVLNNIDRDFNINLLSKRMLRIAKNISLEGREALKQFIPDGDIGKFAVELSAKLLTDFENTKKAKSFSWWQHL